MFTAKFSEVNMQDKNTTFPGRENVTENMHDLQHTKTNWSNWSDI